MIDDALEPESGPSTVVWVDAAPFICDGKTLTYAPHLLHKQEKRHEDGVVWIDGARFVTHGDTLVYTPEINQQREPARTLPESVETGPHWHSGMC